LRPGTILETSKKAAVMIARSASFKKVERAAIGVRSRCAIGGGEGGS